MGRIEYIKERRSTGKFYMGCSVFLFIVSIYVIRYFIERYTSESNLLMPVFALLVAVFWSCNTIKWFVKSIDMMRGEKSGYLKKNPYLLELADEADRNRIYENKVFYITENGMGLVKDPSAITRLSDISKIVRYKKYIDVQCRVGSAIYVETNGYDVKTSLEWIQVLSKYCPTAEVDYDPYRTHQPGEEMLAGTSSKKVDLEDSNLEGDGSEDKYSDSNSEDKASEKQQKIIDNILESNESPIGRTQYIEAYCFEGKFKKGISTFLLLLSFLPIGYSVICYLENKDSMMLVLTGIIFLLWSVPAMKGIIKGMEIMKGENSKFLMRNRHLLQLVDEASWNRVYENHLFYITDNAIGSKAYILNICRLFDVLLVENTSGNICIYLRDGKKFYINVKDCENETVQEWLQIIVKHCPNARLGSDPEGRQYLNEQRQRYKNEMKKYQ